MDILLILLAIGLTIGALIGFLGFARTQWLLVKPGPLGPTGWIAGPGGRVASRLSEAAWSEAYHDLLDRARRDLAEDGSPAAIEAAGALELLSPLRPVLASKTREAAIHALETGEPQSVLVEADGLVLATVVIAGRHEHPKLLRRHSPFRDGWKSYAEGLREVIARDGRASRVLNLLFFLNPDARDGVMLLAYRSDSADLSPAYLAEDSGSRGAAYPEHFEFRLT